MNLTGLAIRRPVTASMVFLALCLLGVFSLYHLPVDLMPNSKSGSLTIHIGIRGGLPPEDIESLVTKPVEDAVSTTARLKSLLSVSHKDRSVTTLTFEPGTDVSFAALDVQERVAKIRAKLPRDIEKPVIAHYQENDYPVVILALTSDKFSPEQLRDRVDNNLKPALMRQEGVANVEVGGGRERKILVEFDQQRLDAYGLAIQRVINQLGQNNLNLLAGRMDASRESFFARVQGQYETIEDLKKLPIALTKEKEGSHILLQDVAEVRDFYLEPQSYARLNKKPTVSVYVQKESLANTIRTATRIEKVVEDFKKRRLEKEITLEVVSNQAVFIREAISNVISAIWQGALLTALCLWLFIRDLRHTSIILLSIPLSVLVIFALMYVSRLGINVMTLSGIALGIGMLVDNSIVVLENIVEKKESYFRGHPDENAVDRGVSDPLVMAASREMTLPILASTLCTVIVFIPILFINKQVQLLYSGLALTVTYSLISSFFVAIMIVPLLASRIPMRRVLPGEKSEDQLIWEKTLGRVPAPSFIVRTLRWFVGLFKRLWEYLKNPAPLRDEAGRAPAKKRWWVEGPGLMLEATISPVLREPLKAYRQGMAWSVRNRYKMLGMVAAAFLVTGFVYTNFLAKDFMGSTEQDEFIIFVELPAGTKLEISDQVVAEVERVVSDTPEIKDVVKTAAARVEGWSSKVYVTLVPQAERNRPVQDIIDELRPQLKDIGGQFDAFIYFSEPSSSKEFLVDVFGHDYDKLRNIASEISQRLQNVKGLADLKLRYKPGRPEVRVTVDKEKAAYFGLSVRDIGETLHAQIRGLRATWFQTDADQIEVVARDLERFRKTVEDLRFLTVTTESGAAMPVQQVVEFSYALTPSEIYRKDKQRTIQVSANREKLALSSAADKTLEALKKMEVPAGYYYQVGGDYQDMLENEREFKFAFIIMVFLIFILLACLFESYAQPVLIMLTVPLAVISVVPVLWATRTPVTMGVYLGLIMLGGLVVTNAIILLDRLNARPPDGDVLRSIMTVGKSRLRAIVLVQLTTILGLLPLIWDNSSSSSLWSPLAIAVVGGITGATFLTLFVVPASYLIGRDWSRFKEGRLALPSWLRKILS